MVSFGKKMFKLKLQKFKYWGSDVAFKVRKMNNIKQSEKVY